MSNYLASATDETTLENYASLIKHQKWIEVAPLADKF